MVEQARALAAGVDTADDAFKKVLARLPSGQERATVSGFLDRQTENRGGRKEALAELARVLMNSNEFLYVD